ncbi:hypothetical protein [Methylocystis bryophila]|uniref:Uncharacterized protein n=1 Tax=Methylocystis bryophila TaxID=655015 RepID=A0A1W6MXX2_9HYPH|nr:hypothetical protein [Methylocystis bryophila]ARN82442.1 hypothetical protein B1812_16650 [Methylocystis bryophila]BDV38626.1 hypothetical protein DSM21852_18790 [Methylocystis bryophila]
MSIPTVNIVTAESPREVPGVCLRLSQEYWRATEALMLATHASNSELARRTQGVVTESYALLRELGRSGF